MRPSPVQYLSARNVPIGVRASKSLTSERRAAPSRRGLRDLVALVDRFFGSAAEVWNDTYLCATALPAYVGVRCGITRRESSLASSSYLAGIGSAPCQVSVQASQR